MTFDPCGSVSTQPTCAGEVPDGDSKFLCEEVCVCPDGQVLDGDKCVTEAECGCKLESGGYIQVLRFSSQYNFISSLRISYLASSLVPS